MEFKDRTLVCEDCGEEFTFSAKEQEFFASKGFQYPKRCKTCRGRRKEAKKWERRMYAAVCSDCGRETEVPFEPTQGRPVYCRECYQKRR